MRTVVVTGSRDWTNLEIVRRVVSRLKAMGVQRVIHGACHGLDWMLAREAKGQGLETVPVYADWDAYGKRAGPLRNGLMLDTYAPEFVVAFPTKLRKHGGGTWNCVKQAEDRGIPVKFGPLFQWGEDE